MKVDVSAELLKATRFFGYQGESLEPHLNGNLKVRPYIHLFKRKKGKRKSIIIFILYHS